MPRLFSEFMSDEDYREQNFRCSYDEYSIIESEKEELEYKNESREYALKTILEVIKDAEKINTNKAFKEAILIITQIADDTLKGKPTL